MALSKTKPVPGLPSGIALAALRPSEYTAALIQVLQANADCVRGATVLEIGSGSGVVLAALGALGAASLCGIDIEEDAVASGMLLLEELGHGKAAELHHGDMWSPVGERRFDLIVANLPHFPMDDSASPRAPADLERRRRRRPAPARSVPRGAAPAISRRAAASFITHNAFVGLERSRQIVEGLRLCAAHRSDDARLYFRRQARAA